jgi:hypothetical protein
VPSLVQTNQPFEVRMALTDRYLVPARVENSGKLKIYTSEDPQINIDQVSLSEFQGADHTLADARFKTPGGHKIHVIDESGLLQDNSNPVLITEEEVREQIYWGDLHNQSKYHGLGSWSVGTPDELYQYARGIAHLDFAGITDDAAPLSPGWQEIQQAAIDHYEPGKFVTFKAFEWCTKRYGHRNTIFADVEMEGNYPRELFDGCIEDFWDYFRSKDVIMIPHHTLVWTDWNYYDPELEPLLEIYSIWGSSERPGNPLWNHSCVPGGGAQAALARGYRLGIIGSTDTHAGTPGRSIPNSDRFDWQPYKGGIAAVYAPELTRKAIFEALKNRRTYGTTGVRIILDFQLSDHPMGSLIEGNKSDQRRITVRAIGTDRIRKVEIIRNNHTICCHAADDFQVEFEFMDEDRIEDFAAQDETGNTVVFYYVRVTQVDQEMAWSSPIWFQCFLKR